LSRSDVMEQKIRNLVSRGILKRVAYDGNRRRLQLTARRGFTIDDVEHLEPYGVTTHALPGAEVVVANLGGNRGRSIVLLTHDRRHRVVIAEGEVALYTHQGEMIHLRQDGSIQLKAATSVSIESPLTHITHNLQVDGDATFNSTVVANGKSIDETHQHTGDSGGTTGPVL
jgi:phage baseplate assembly protein V